MREAIGGTFLINLMITFLVIYNGLFAVAVNYAIAFRVKNQIINILEQNEGCKNSMDNIINYVDNVGYYRGFQSANARGFEINATQISGRGTFYGVTTHIAVDLPLINRFKIDVFGETEIIYNVYEENLHCNQRIN